MISKNKVMQVINWIKLNKLMNMLQAYVQL